MSLNHAELEIYPGRSSCDKHSLLKSLDFFPSSSSVEYERKTAKCQTFVDVTR